jgi:hypothetical protein
MKEINHTVLGQGELLSLHYISYPLKAKAKVPEPDPLHFTHKILSKDDIFAIYR